MSNTLRLLWATLREIFDEAAYERFLQRTGDERSPESFTAFLEVAKAARKTPSRCC